MENLAAAQLLPHSWNYFLGKECGLLLLLLQVLPGRVNIQAKNEKSYIAGYLP